MANFLYLSDVFCPWCYGFAPVMRRLTAEHPDWSIRVLGGGLIDEPSTVAEMAEEMPNMREFFVRLASTTGQAVGDGFLRLLEPGQGGRVRMYSPAVAAPLVALKALAPDRALDQIEAFQHAFYGEGRDVLSLGVQRELAASFGVDAVAFEKALHGDMVLDTVQREMDEAADIMGEFVLYPTLYLEDGGQRHLLARGFVSYDEVVAKLAEAHASASVLTTMGAAMEPAMGHACSLDGKCD